MEFTQGTKMSAAHFSVALDYSVEFAAGLRGNRGRAQNGEAASCRSSPWVGCLVAVSGAYILYAK